METKGIVVFICQDIPTLKDVFIPSAKIHGFEPKHFSYPEDFEEWVQEKRPNLKNIKLILLGQYFPGDGSKQRESSPSRGVLFYKRIRENNELSKVKLLLSTGSVYPEKYIEKLEEYNVSLKKGDEPIDILDIYKVYEKTLEELRT